MARRIPGVGHKRSAVWPGNARNRRHSCASGGMRDKVTQDSMPGTAPNSRLIGRFGSGIFPVGSRYAESNRLGDEHTCIAGNEAPAISGRALTPLRRAIGPLAHGCAEGRAEQSFHIRERMNVQMDPTIERQSFRRNPRPRRIRQIRIRIGRDKIAGHFYRRRIMMLRTRGPRCTQIEK